MTAARMPDATRLRLLVVILRLAGGVTVCAFPAIFLPTDWMTATHGWLGLGEFPRTPIVDYLTRSIAALYGFLGVLVLLVSSDPVRYRAVVQFIAWMNVLFGLIVLGVDIHAGMPALWTATEGPPIAAFGIAIAFLNARTTPGVPRG